MYYINYSLAIIELTIAKDRDILFGVQYSIQTLGYL